MDQLKFHTQRLRVSGLRPTKQRLAICRVLFDRKETFHFTIEKLKKIIEKGNKKKISVATIYNTVNAFKEKMWFFDCHFKEDPVMPGCLGLDAMWQLVGFYLGWIGEPGKGRALGVNTVKFTGEVLKKVKIARYQVSMKRILKKKGAVVGLADGILYSDNKAIYEAEGLKVGLFK